MLKVLNGPLVASGEQVIRGPVVRLGGNPGPGGFKLGGYRGLDARQAVITAYTGGSASVAPVGTNQVRLAPHPNVNWQEIDPINGPEYLSPGCAIHLGPVGRGATIEYIECRRLGLWQEGRLASEASDVPEGQIAAGSSVQRNVRVGAIPAAYDARRVGRIQTSFAPVWFLGCSFLMTTGAAGIIGIAGAFFFLLREVKPLGPEDEGYEFYESVAVEQLDTIDPRLYTGLEQPYIKFVMEPNIAAAGLAGKGFEKPERWDQALFKYVAASVNLHVKSWAFFTRLEDVHVEYSKVVLALRREGLPEVLAAIPYQESRYNASITSEVCAEGWWQLMPEYGYRFSQVVPMDFHVSGCRFHGADSVAWTPTEPTPPPGVRQNAVYIDNDQCMIDKCTTDDRKDLEKATDVAIYTLKEAWQDNLIADSGAAVQLVITSHNAGYDDGRFGPRYKKRFNVKPALQTWIDKNGQDAAVSFLGQQIRCRDPRERSSCDALLMAETQHYAYSIIAQHTLAVCYYAKNYGEDPAFRPWLFFVGKDGYCEQFSIPSKDEVRSRRKGGQR
ncbi:MAG: transglycosylase SLT domain-containing protein [Alphaproteobacteria bacterium]|nr:transglycosylase SLT domain-containing protein [Alphaproteobacteria bacterium]